MQGDLRAALGKVLRLQEAGRLAEAQALCDRLLREHSDSVPLLATRARIARLAGDAEHALSLLRKAHELAPQSVAVLSELGRASMDAGQAEEGAGYFRALTRLRPERPDAWFNLGFASEGCHRHADAIEAYRKALSLGAEDEAEVLTRLAGVLLTTGQEDQADECFDRALSVKPQNPQALFGKGMIQQTSGDFVAAEKLFDQALAADPDFAEVYQQIAELRRFEDMGDPLVVRMQELLAGPRSTLAQEKLHFALGKICDDCGDYDAAFGHFSAANALKKERMPPCDRDAYLALCGAIIDFFDDERVAHSEPFPEIPVTPVFILGMPRSGTTLTEQIVSSHSAVAGAGELAFMDGVSRYHVEDYPRGLAELGASRLAEIRRAYLEEIAAHVPGHRYVTDKFPGNFLHIGLINTLFPEARFIHCRRDAMDNCLSIYMQDFGTGNFYTNSLEDIAFYFRRHDEVMAHWRSLLGPRLLTMQYEDVVEHQESETRRLLEFLDLEWQQACLAFDKNPRKIATLSRWQVRQPIYKTAAGRWRRYASHLGGLQRALASDT